MHKVMPSGRAGRRGRRAALLPLLLPLLGPGAVAAPAAPPGLVAVEAACRPAELGAVALRALGLALAERQLDDRGFAVEHWRAPAAAGEPGAWALVILLRDAAGGERRCLVFHRLPDRGAPT